MIQNYVVVAIRNLRRYASYTFINVLGLSLGMGCALLIFLLVSHHLSYDDYHAENDRIYRLVTEITREQTSYSGSVPAPLGKFVRDDFTYTEKISRLATFDDVLITVTENGEAKKFTQPQVSFAEPDFFDIFSLPMAEGGQATKIIAGAKTAIISESVAKKLFGSKDPINQLFRLDNRMDFRVGGVMKNIPDNTDYRSEIYLSYADLKQYNEWLGSDDSWGGISTDMQCFVRLKPNVDIPEMEEDMFGYVKTYRSYSKNIHHYRLQPLSEVHTDSRFGAVMDVGPLTVLSLIGVFLIITACVNFVNLATARATSRSREVGVRKVLGGLKSQIMWQFMAETFVITLMSVAVSMAIVSAFLPYFNIWFDSRLSLDLTGNWKLLAFLPLLLLFVTFIAGFYPGMVLAGFQAAEALKGKLSQMKAAGLNLRRALIVTQFAISQVLIIVLIVVIYQVNFSKKADLGFNRDATIILPTGSNDEKLKTLKTQLGKISGVENVSLCWQPPASENSWNTSIRFANNSEDETFGISSRLADEDFIELFDIELVAGRNLSASDTLREFLVNEKFAEKLGMSPEEVVGQHMAVNGDWRFPIVGVVKNFHNQSFREDIGAIFIGTRLEDYGSIAVKINMQDASEILSAVEKEWTATYPDLIYSYQFLDDQVAEFYRLEDNILKLIQIFSFVAILVGCLGLFGLVSYMSIQRTKEIGIRKVLGGSIAQILWIFGKEFTLLILMAFAVAAPAGWLAMNKWLQLYEFHIQMNAWIFVGAISFTFVVALVTVGYRSLQAATANPVDSLKSE
jgi:putative ABC transport system permease protein